MKVFVISLKTATQRRNAIAKGLGAAGVEFSFYDAIDGRAMDIANLKSYRRKKRLAKYGLDLTPGELGACLSHYGVISDAFRSSTPRALFLEDDAIIPPSLGDILKRLEDLPQSFELIKLYGGGEPTSIDLADIGGGRRLVRVLGTSSGSVAYVLSRSGAAKILATEKSIVRQVDVEMDRYWSHGARTFAVLPFPVDHLSAGGPSDIGERVDVWDLPGMKHWRRKTKLAKIPDSIRKRVKNLQILFDHMAMI